MDESDLKAHIGDHEIIVTACPIIPEPEAEPDEVRVEGDFCEGGARAWLVVVGGFLGTFASLGYSHAFGVYQDLYTRSGTASASRVSWIGSTQTFLTISLGLPTGKLFDMGYCRETSIFGSVLLVFSIFMSSLADPIEYYQLFLSQGLGIGIGAGFLFCPSMAIQSHYFKKRRPIAMGIAIAGSAIGGVVYPIMLNQLFKSIGYAEGVRASAYLTLGIVIVANILMIPRAPKTKSNDQASLLAILMDPPFAVFILGFVFNLIVQSHRVLKYCIDSAFLIQCAYLLPLFYLQLYAMLHHVDKSIAFYSLALLNGVSTFGRILFNILAQRVGLMNTFILVSICTGALIFLMLGALSVPGTLAMAIVYGIFEGAFGSVIVPTAASMAQHPGEIGIRMGLTFGLVSTGNLIGPPIAGKMLGHSPYEWTNMIAFGSTVAIAGGLVLIVSRFLLVQRRKTWKV